MGEPYGDVGKLGTAGTGIPSKPCSEAADLVEVVNKSVEGRLSAGLDVRS